MPTISQLGFSHNRKDNPDINEEIVELQQVIPPSGVEFQNLNINTFQTNQDIQSENFVSGSAGWKIKGSGDAEFQNATINGSITATTGAIGGWNINSTTIYSDSNEIILDSDNTNITVGASNPITIDGANTRIRSDNYVAGSSGFTIESDLIEAGNLAARGILRTAVFQKDVISSVGGNLMVLDSDVLSEDMTNDSTTLTIDGNTTFSSGDILRIKDGTDDEWLEVTNIGLAPTYTVDRNKKGDYSIQILDSYSESYYTTSIEMTDNIFEKIGQSFTGDGNTLNSCKFYLKKKGSPTGNVTANIYAHSGTFGVNGVPTGSPLATSDNVDVSTISASNELVTFTFTGDNNITLTNGVHYFIIISYIGSGTDNIGVGVDVILSGTTDGNYASLNNEGGSWTSTTNTITCFYVYTKEDNKPSWTKGATVVNYGQSGDGGIFMTASESNAPYLSIFDHAGEPWDTINTRLRIGNLNGYLGYSSDLYGIAIGETDKYLKYDSTNGMRIKGTVTIESGSTGIANLGDAGNLVTMDEDEIDALNLINAPAAANADVTKTIIDGGLITTGYITLNTAGHIKSGQTAYETGTGFWLGNDGGIPKFSIGNTTDYLKWTGNDISMLCSGINAITINHGSDILLKEGGDLKFTSVTAPGTCTGALAGDGSGNVDDGDHIYKVTYVNATGETGLGTASNTVTVADKSSNGKIDLSNIPVSSSSSVTSRKIYRTKAGGSDYYLLDTIADNTTTTYEDNIADSSLTGSIANLRENDSFGKILVDDKESFSVGSQTIFIGQESGNSITTGYSNLAIGTQSLYSNTAGHSNLAIGYQSLKTNVTGYGNIGIGYQSLYFNTNHKNTAIGFLASVGNTSGASNTAIGYNALVANQTGAGNIALGASAGYYETGSNKLFIDNAERASEADGRVKALIYGVFDAAIANQLVRLNGVLELTSIKSGSTQANAGAAANEVWKTASHASLPDNVLMIGV